MARAETYTLLSLDRFFQLIGYDLLHANQLKSALRPVGSCSDVLYQHNWQQPAQAGREEIALAIRQAEQDIAAWINYWPLPTWIVDERQPTVKPARREIFSDGRNVRYLSKSVRTRYGHWIVGGQRTKTLIDDNVTLTYSDSDGDGYDETATATVTTTVTDACEVRAYFPGESGSDAWEIRPITVSISGGVATLTMQRHQLVDPDLWEALDADDTGAIDADVDANFITQIDVYRVWNDPQTQVQFLYEPENCANCNGSGCEACVFVTQYGCLSARDERMGHIMYRPATWDADDETFDLDDWTACREPDKLRLWYYAGLRDMDRACPTLQMHPYLERTIVMLALACIQGDLCNCSATKTFFEWAQTDLAENPTAEGTSSFMIAQRALACPWGTRRGAVEAFARCNADGWRLAR